MVVELDIDPLDANKLDQRLQQLSETLQTRAVRSGLRAAGKPIAAKASQLAPYDDDPGHSGHHLKDAMNTTLLGKKRANQVHLFTSARGRLTIDNPGNVMVIGPNKKLGGYHQGWKGALMEFGTSLGERIGKRGRMKGSRYLSRGVRPQPFLAPALAAESSGINGRFYQGLERYLKRQEKQ